MVVLTGHFDGRNVVFDGPVPEDIPADTPVKVVFETIQGGESLARIAKLAVRAGLPSDYAEQHEHYVKGTPRR